MLIRHAREDDADAMAQLIVDTFFAAHATQIPAEALQRRRDDWTHETSAKAWRRPLRAIASGAETEDCIFVACTDDGDLIGLAMGTPAEGLTHTGEVSAVYVRPDQQGRGIGRQLVQTVATWLHARGHNALRIMALAANAPARRFYETLGGTVVDEMEMDEYGCMLPFVVYGWPDIRALIPSE